MVTPLYFTHGKLIASSNNVRVFKFQDMYYLEIGEGHTLWAISDEIEEYKEQIANKPYGNCLEIGLGLGVASKYILSRPIKSLTTIEKNKDVINVFEQLNPIKDKKHTILNEDGLYFLQIAREKYDFIFLDFYDVIDEDTLPYIKYAVVLSKALLTEGGNLVGWFDPFTPDDLAEQFWRLF